jgi:hypothetical protein
MFNDTDWRATTGGIDFSVLVTALSTENLGDVSHDTERRRRDDRDDDGSWWATAEVGRGRSGRLTRGFERR